jgi:hypothetical protein
VAEGSLVGQFGFWARKTRIMEEHRTEVTEGFTCSPGVSPRTKETRDKAGRLTYCRLAVPACFPGEPATQELKR